MPEIIPIRDLKNTNAISQRCHETQEPIFVTKSGYGDMVIMSIKAPRMLSGEFLFISSRVFFLAHWLIISTIIITAEFKLRQYRIIPALRLKHRSGGCGTASALPKCSIRHPVLSALLAWHLPHLARRIGT